MYYCIFWRHGERMRQLLTVSIALGVPGSCVDGAHGQGKAVQRHVAIVYMANCVHGEGKRSTRGGQKGYAGMYIWQIVYTGRAKGVHGEGKGSKGKAFGVVV